MPKSSTTLKKGDNLPARGKAKRTLILEAIREQSLIDSTPDSTQEETERLFFGHIAKRALNPEDPNSSVLIKTLMDKGWASVKPSMELVEYSYDPNSTLSDQASQIMGAVSKRELAPDVANMLIGAIASMLKIEEITKIKDEIEEIKRLMGESDG